MTCWGSNYSGELGLGDRNFRPYPVRIPTYLSSGIPEASPVIERVTVTNHFSCAGGAERLYCWGGFGGGYTNNICPPVISNLQPETIPREVRAPATYGTGACSPDTVIRGIRDHLLGENFVLAKLEDGSFRRWGGGVNADAHFIEPMSSPPKFALQTQWSVVAEQSATFPEQMRYYTTDAHYYSRGVERYPKCP